MALSFIENDLRFNVARTQRKLSVHLLERMDDIENYIDSIYFDLNEEWDNSETLNSQMTIDCVTSSSEYVLKLIERSKYFITQTIQKFCSTLIYDDVTQNFVKCLDKLRSEVLKFDEDLNNKDALYIRDLLSKLHRIRPICTNYRQMVADIENFGPKLR